MSTPHAAAGDAVELLTEFFCGPGPGALTGQFAKNTIGILEYDDRPWRMIPAGTLTGDDFDAD
jgi:hypothetical protein